MNRRLIMIAGGVSALLLVAWLMLLWMPKGHDLEAAKARRTSADDQVQQLELKLDGLQDAQRRAPELVASLDRLRSAVPEDPSLASFLLATNDAATASHVDFISITPAPPALGSAGGPSEIRVALNITGGYFEALDFLDRLGDLPRVVVVDDFKVTVATEDGASAGGLNIALTGRIFTTQLPVGVTTTTAPAAGSSASSSTPTTGVAAPQTNAAVNQ